MSASRRRLKYVATINDDALGEDTDADFEIQYVDISNVDSSGNIGDIVTYRFGDAPSRARRCVRDGDVIISTVRTYLQAIAPISKPPANLIVSTGFAVVRPRKDVFDAQYCKYALREPEFLSEVERYSVGVSYPAINVSDLASIPVHVHSLSQQRAIADYLDRETGRIDALIAAKERLLALLAEKRRALITRAVTRGLDPSAPLRDSGIPWLGQTPAHWKKSPLKFMAGIQTGYAFSSDEYTDEGVPVLRIGDITEDGSVDFSAARYLPEDYKTSYSNVLITRGAIVMAMTGATIGKAGKYFRDDLAFLNQRVCSFYSKGQNDQNFLWYILRADFYLEHVKLRAFGSAQPNISDTELLDCVVAIPPPSEQTMIADYLDRETARMDALKVAIDRSIALLKERRAALIAAAVTGEIKEEDVV